MPWKSQAQRRLFYAKMNRGEISKKTVQEWEHATPKNKKLPEHVGKKAAAFAESRLKLNQRKFHGVGSSFKDATKGVGQSAAQAAIKKE